MKIWLDDIRPPPDDSWTHVKLPYRAMQLLKEKKVEEVSFDHDLGTELSGYDVISWLEFMHRTKHTPVPEKLHCHSDNPPGRQRIEMVIQQLREFQEEHGEVKTEDIG
jgi:hypothetical protein